MVEKYHRRGYLPASRHKRFRGLRGGGSLRPGKKPARKGKTGSGSTGGELEVGAFVSIHGLKKMVDLNGATATVVGVVKNPDTLNVMQVVELHESGARMHVNALHLRVQKLNVTNERPYMGPPLYGVKYGNQVQLSPEQSKQTFPPAVPLRKIYPKNCSKTSRWPIGEIITMTNPGISSLRDRVKLADRSSGGKVDIIALREAAEVHRQVRQYVYKFIRPGLPLLEVAQRIENATKFLVRQNGTQRGWGFPTGLSVNHVAAHYTPNYGEPERIIRFHDVIKVDFGVQIKGWIIDSAFSIAFDKRHLGLLEASKKATEAGIRAAGIGVKLKDIGAAIQNVMESYTSELSNTNDIKKRNENVSVRIRVISDLGGHSMKRYDIHAGKSVPCVACNDDTRMEAGEVYAIETFASTGTGVVEERGNCSHYMWNSKCDLTKLKQRLLKKPSAFRLAQHIRSRYHTLAFCRRWLDDAGFKNHLAALSTLVNAKAVTPYPPIVDHREGCFVAQFEHTIYLGPNGKEVLSRGSDY
uniref:Methionine aminopeptidase 2 n=1 Tax=Amorphochlora amoebiformis TaxID=1561963 RepID=A0A7S0DS25_9EUKA